MTGTVVTFHSIGQRHAVCFDPDSMSDLSGRFVGCCNGVYGSCRTGAIQMIVAEPEKETSPQIPAINTERCIGCGACENLCPARPFSAIYVEGHERHRII